MLRLKLSNGRMCSSPPWSFLSEQCFEVRLHKEGFTSLGLLCSYGPGIDGIVVAAVSEDGSSLVGCYNASAPEEARIRAGQAIEKVNGLTDGAAMSHEISNARVLKITFNPRLNEQQHQVLRFVERRRHHCEDLFDCFDRVHDVEDEQCAICFENMKESSESILRTPCGHCFHRTCLSTWFFERGERCLCPLCNFQLRKGAAAKDRVQRMVRASPQV